MSFNDKFLHSIFLVLGFMVGISFSKLYANIGFLEFDGKVNIVSAAGLFVSTCIAIGIPFFLKKFIDDNRYIKSFLATEILSLIETLCEIKTVFSLCYDCGKITPEDKIKIGYIIYTAELQINSISEQVKISFNKRAKKHISELKEHYFIYNEGLTGGVLMTPEFTTVDDNFRKNHDTELNTFVTHLKNLVHMIHKF